MAASLPTQAQQALTWQAYGADASNLVCPIPCDFTTYSAYTFNPQGVFRQRGVTFATGVVVDNLLNSSPVIVTIGPITETIPGYTKTTLQLGGTSAQVTVMGQQSRLIVTFFFGNYLGTTGGTNYYAAQIAAGLAVETGFINMFAGSTAAIPVGYLLCDGTAVSRTTYAGLFSVIGTLYGPGDGSTTFNLPDLTSRVPMGAGTGSGLSTRGLGSKGGAEQVILTATQMPVHTHAITDPGHGHSVTDNGHNHGINDPGHAHGVTDPTHGHGFNVYNSDNSLRNYINQVKIQDVNSSRFGYNTQTNYNFPYLIGHPSNYDGGVPGTGFYPMIPSYSTTGITVNGGKSGVNCLAAPAYITINSQTTGITLGNAGGQGGTTQPTPTVPPYTAVNYVIKT